MKFIKISINADFTQTSLDWAICQLKEAGGDTSQMSLIISSSVLRGEVLAIQFAVLGALSIPFELSDIMPTDSWMLLDCNGNNILYSPGA